MPTSLSKTADRPHNITIALGLLSPLFALVAVIVSTQSFRVSQEALRTSQRSLEVGQRAYLTMTDGRVSFQESEPSHMFYEFNIHNFGNTPATINSIKVVYKLPVGWSIDDKSINVQRTKQQQTFIVVLEHTPQYIAPKSTVNTLQGVGVRLTPQARKTFDQKKIEMDDENPFGIRGLLVYEDIFGHRHPLTWCWDSPAYAEVLAGEHHYESCNADNTQVDLKLLQETDHTSTDK